MARELRGDGSKAIPLRKLRQFPRVGSNSPPFRVVESTAHDGLADIDASLSNSPWMRGAPQSGFSPLIFRISWRISVETVGRPGWPRRTFQVQTSRKPLRCQPIAVSGLTMTKADRQSLQTSHSQVQKSRRVDRRMSIYRFTERRRIGAERDVPQLKGGSRFEHR